MADRVIPLSPERERAERDALRRGKNARPVMLNRSSITVGVTGAAETATARISGAAVIIYCRDTSDVRRDRGRFFARWSMTAELVWEGPPGEPSAWLVVAGADGDPVAAFTALRSQWWVRGCERVMSGRVGGRASGGGELGEGAKRRLRTLRELRLKDGEEPPTERDARGRFPAVLAANGVPK